MSYSVHFVIELQALSDAERRQIEQTMQQIAEVVDTVPKASPFWASMKDSVLQIDVMKWRVVYRVDPAHHDIVVTELARLRG